MMDSPADYIAHVNKVRERVSVVARKLKQPPLSTDFDPFHLQEEALKVRIFWIISGLFQEREFIPGPNNIYWRLGHAQCKVWLGTPQEQYWQILSCTRHMPTLRLLELFHYF